MELQFNKTVAELNTKLNRVSRPQGNLTVIRCTMSRSTRQAAHQPVSPRDQFIGNMTPDESRALNVGDRVYWLDDKRDQGTVIERDWSGLSIKWDRGASPIFYYHNDTARLTKVHVIIW